MSQTEQLNANYKYRINRVFDYIDQNLETDLSLTKLAEIACFSPYHFHRIFKFITGETLNEFIKRRRIETSALELLHNNSSITAIAHKFGFSDNSSFSKAFKNYFKVSPTEFRKQNPHRHTRISQLKSKNGQAYPDSEKYICILTNLKKWIAMNATVNVKTIPKMDLAYVSAIGAQNLQSAYRELMRWATPLGLLNKQTKMLTLYHDSFKVTAADKVRMSAAMLIDTPLSITGEIGVTSIPAGKCIVANFTIGVDEFEKSWTGLFLWMNENGYAKAEREPFEIYHNNFNEHPEKKAIVDFYIPIQ
ncbi:AraC family transcriptional regulator [Zunongwangia sp.]|uniref:AraC family transcriptional regulator n=1 Tax=Zunongwangia sp. TaxID=1965325 RepID=UPI003AA7AF6A